MKPFLSGMAVGAGLCVASYIIGAALRPDLDERGRPIMTFYSGEEEERFFLEQRDKLPDDELEAILSTPLVAEQLRECGLKNLFFKPASSPHGGSTVSFFLDEQNSGPLNCASNLGGERDRWGISIIQNPTDLVFDVAF